MNRIQRTILLFLGFSCFITVACSTKERANQSSQQSDQQSDQQQAQQSDQQMLQQWKAGSKVSAQSVESFGLKHCFASMEISDPIFNRMYKKSFKEDCTVPKEKLRYVKLLHYNLDKQICLGEIVCSKDLADELIEIFKVLYKAQYPIEKMLLVDDYDADDEASASDNNSSCFNFRLIAGTTRLSNHSTGRAIDINPRYNPYLKWLNGDLYYTPKNGLPYIDRTADFPYKIDREDLCFKEFSKHGFIWGGGWSNRKDYQHFEKPE